MEQGDVLVHASGLRVLVEYNDSGRPARYSAIREEAIGFLDAATGLPLQDAQGGRLVATGRQELEGIVAVLRSGWRRPDDRYWQHWNVLRNGADRGTIAELRQQHHNVQYAAQQARDGPRQATTAAIHPSTLAQNIMTTTYAPRVNLVPGAMQNLWGQAHTTMPPKTEPDLETPTPSAPQSMAPVNPAPSVNPPAPANPAVPVIPAAPVDSPTPANPSAPASEPASTLFQFDPDYVLHGVNYVAYQWYQTLSPAARLNLAQQPIQALEYFMRDPNHINQNDRASALSDFHELVRIWHGLNQYYYVAAMGHFEAWMSIWRDYKALGL